MSRITRRRVAGQAFSEALVALIFLIPLLLCMVYLVDLMRAEQGAVVTARELALAAVHAPDGRAAPEVINDLQELAMPGAETAGERLAPRIAPSAVSTPAANIESGARLLLAPAQLVGIGDFDVPELLTQRAITGVGLGSVSELGVPLDIPVQVGANLDFVAGHGAALSPAQVRGRTAALSVAGALAEVAEPIETLATIASLLEPSLRRLCVGRIDPDIVPADRLPDSVSRSSDLRNQPC